MSSGRSRRGGKLDREGADAVVEIAAKASSSGHCAKVAMSGAHQPKIRVDLLDVADASEDSGLQQAQQLDLQRQGDVAHLVEKQVPPSAASTSPVLRPSAPVKAPFSWPKSSLSKRDSVSPEQSTGTKGRGLGDSGRAARRRAPCRFPTRPAAARSVSAGATLDTSSSMRLKDSDRPTSPSTLVGTGLGDPRRTQDLEKGGDLSVGIEERMDRHHLLLFAMAGVMDVNSAGSLAALCGLYQRTTPTCFAAGYRQVVRDLEASFPADPVAAVELVSVGLIGGENPILRREDGSWIAQGFQQGRNVELGIGAFTDHRWPAALAREPVRRIRLAVAVRRRVRSWMIHRGGPFPAPRPACP